MVFISGFESLTLIQVRSMPIHKGDEIEVVRGSSKGREGKVLTVYRRKYVIHVDKLIRDKANGTQVNIGVHPSKVVIKNLKLDKDRKALLQRKSQIEDGKYDKITEGEVKMSGVD